MKIHQSILDYQLMLKNPLPKPFESWGGEEVSLFSHVEALVRQELSEYDKILRQSIYFELEPFKLGIAIKAVFFYDNEKIGECEVYHYLAPSHYKLIQAIKTTIEPLIKGLEEQDEEYFAREQYEVQNTQNSISISNGWEQRY